ncbi:hypothetical protein SanaruYs_29410 [Chryseotalea sanaruensis]|uniref:ABC transporter permease n=1 Tax=Chryseotalea sanaruensis TaxID=2482724 RepID=A0A401UCU8_9BACT|nr:ABC transporter permease [Chryseotalea sanaruensis]GCC52703.1 hypothetical protein SanaruYs_29410 [Chryseotalea sanaruensis]
MKKSPDPPKTFHRFFRWYCNPDLRNSIEGDLIELYHERVREEGKKQADRKFVKDVLLLFRPGIIKSIELQQYSLNTDMYKNYFATAWRNLNKKKVYASINIAGLALGIGCALLIFSLITHHLDFDNFHADSDRIYRFVTEEHRDQIDYDGSVPPVFGKAFREDYTFGEKVARLCTIDEQLIAVGEGSDIRKFSEEIAFAEPEFFSIFNFPLASGNADKVLSGANTAIITERIAKKYFGDEPALGKTFRFENRIDFTISGVLKDIPENTDFRSEIYFSYSTINQYSEWYASDDAWGGISSSIQTFVRLQPGVNPQEVEKVLPDYVKKYRAKSKNVHHYKLQAISDVHFNARYGGKMDKSTLWVLAAIGLLLVFTACLNFINLATAQAITRAKEVGVRKVLGSARAQLFWQFTIETGVIVLLASAIAFSGAYLILPNLNTFFDTRISLDLFLNTRLLLFLALLILLVTLLSGAYPGIILSRFKPVAALKGRLQGQQGGSFNIRRGLIIVQFTISQILLIGLIIMMQQMKYFSNTNMGFAHDATVMIPTGSNDEKLKTLKDQFLALPDVENVSLCFAAPASDDMWTTSLLFDNRSESETFSISFKGADENYLSTFDLELVAGRNFTASDTAREFLVNEKTITKLGLSSAEEILGRQLSANGGSLNGPVVGVIKDFHDRSFQSDIQPLFITTSLEHYNALAVKIKMNNISNTLAALEKNWSAAYPELIYSYSFLDDQIASFYQKEQRMITMVQVFSCIALLIGCIGLYGLVSFLAVQKTKEIGIRKVLGSSVTQILTIFGKEFSYLLLIAFIIAAPITWLLMSNWLSGYTYRIDIDLWIYALELGIISAIVLFTVGYQSLKAAIVNPVESLKSE